MRIVFVAAKFAPFSDSTEESLEVADIAAKMVNNDQQVEAIFPMMDGIEPDKFSLARRLKKIEINTSTFERYDGRSASNVEVHLLREIGDNTSDDLRTFATAANSMLNLQPDEDAIFFWWNLAPPAIIETRSSTSTQRHIAVVTHNNKHWNRPDNLDHIIITGHLLAKQLIDKHALKDGEYSVIPRAVDTIRRLKSNDRISAKATLQATTGLPVRPDIPLIFWAQPHNEKVLTALEGVLTGNVQVILPMDDAPKKIIQLAERYPDRLSTISPMPAKELLLAGSDLTLCLSSNDLALRAMSFGSFPVVEAANAEGIVDLEPSLKSGSGFIINSNNSSAIIAAVDQGIAAFCKAAEFRALSERIPDYVTNRDRQAEILLQAAIKTA